MGRRFLTTTALLDVTSLGLAIIVGIALVPNFGAGVETVEVAPLLATMFLGALLGSMSFGCHQIPDPRVEDRAMDQHEGG